MPVITICTSSFLILEYAALYISCDVCKFNIRCEISKALKYFPSPQIPGPLVKFDHINRDIIRQNRRVSFFFGFP